MKKVALGAAVTAAAIAGTATAGLAPTTFSVNSVTVGDTVTEDYTIDFYDFGTEDYLDPNTTNGLPDGFFITVDSGPSDREGFDFELTLDYSAYDIGFFGPAGTHQINLFDVYDDGSIIDVAVKTADGGSIGTISTDGNSITWDTSVGDVLDAIGPNEDQLITIQFAIPAPGALALLGMAGLGAGRRRRA